MNRNRSGRAPVAPGGELALLAAADGSYALVREQASTADLHLAIFAQAPGLEVGRPGSCGPATGGLACQRASAPDESANQIAATAAGANQDRGPA